MKRAKIISLALAAVFAAGLVTAGCKKSDGKITAGLKTIKFPDTVQTVDLNGDGFVDYDRFLAQSTTNEASEEGVIVSPYYEAEATSAKDTKTEVYVYSVPMLLSEVHSFGYIEADKNDFPIKIIVNAKYEVESAVVIPEKFGITPTVENDEISFTVEDFGSYNLLFNGKYNFERPLTFFVRENENIDKDGRKIVDYDGADGIITVKSGTTLRFKSGYHIVDALTMESNSAVYLETGAYILARMPDKYNEPNVINDSGNNNWQAFFKASGVDNVKVYGHGVIDFSRLSLHARHPFNFQGCRNVEVDGLTLLHGAAWNLLITDCENIKVNDMVIFGYRMNSDGIALCNCKNGLVTNSWIRSGDDLFEVKATKGQANVSGTGGSNLVWRNNQAWAEKTRGFGFIQETQMDVDGILFEDCSLLCQTATWNEAMGGFLVIVGDGHKVKNVTFKNCDSYYCLGYVANISAAPNMWTITDLPENAHDPDSYGSIENITFDGFKFSYDYSGEESTLTDSFGNYAKSGGGIKLSVADHNHAGVYGGVENLKDITFKDIYVDGVKAEKLENLPFAIKNTGVDLIKNNIRLVK